ncbi:MAG: helix-turn-helix transcriptional regulator [Pseudomonadota bacterium]
MTEYSRKRMDELAQPGVMTNEQAAFRIVALRSMAQIKSRREIGEMIHVTEDAITKVEHGDNRPSWELMVKLYEYTNVDPTFIVTGDYDRLPVSVRDELFAHLVLTEEKDRRRQKA